MANTLEQYDNKPRFWWLFILITFQVVRYHSLIIDADSLPNELIPIAWTASTDALSFLGRHKLAVIPDTSADSFPTKRQFSCSDRVEERKVLMGIMHSTRPHYGLQVCCMAFLFYFIAMFFWYQNSHFIFGPQFHPESVATCYGKQIFKNFREITENYWRKVKPSFPDQRGFQYAGKLDSFERYFFLICFFFFFLFFCFFGPL